MSPVVVPTGATPTVSEFIGKIRTDLFDAGQRTGEQPRWLDGDIARALDRANDKYSSVAPYLKQELMCTIPGSRIYPCPEDCWWIDSVEYPYGQWPKWYQTFQEALSPYIPEPPDGGAGVTSIAGTAMTGSQTWYMALIAPGGGTTVPGTHRNALRASWGASRGAADRNSLRSLRHNRPRAIQISRRSSRETHRQHRRQLDRALSGYGV